MTSPSALVNNVAFMLFQNLKEGMETGRVANMDTAQTEVEAAMAELDSKRLAEEPTTHLNDLVGKLFLELGSLHESVAKCQAQLSEFQCLAMALKEDTTQIVARTEACNLLVEQQQKENTKILAAMEEVKATMPTPPSSCPTPAPSPTNSILRSAPSSVAIVSFPGGPRTITIHPPGSPSYQSIIRDAKGDVIIDFRRTKPLRREGAFRGPLEDVDLSETTRVYGRGPDLLGARAVPPTPSWPDRSHPSSCPPPSHGPSDLIARQRQLSTSMQTDPFGRVLAPEYLNSAKSPLLPAGVTSSSHESSREIVLTPSSTPRSLGRGKKRARNSEDDKDVPPTTETREKASLPVDLRTVKEPTTPTPVKREESQPPEGPTKRRKLCTSGSLEGLSTVPLSRTRSLLDLTRPA